MKKSVAFIDCSVKDPAYVCFNRLKNEVDEELNYYNFPKYQLDGLDYDQEPSAIISLGSHSNIGDGSTWHAPLANYLLEKLSRGIPVFGICFTHQLMAHTFGSSLKKNTDDMFLEGLRYIDLNEELFNLKRKSLSLFTAHFYQIDKLSPELKVVGSSKDSPYEFLKHKSLPYFSCQSHPEGSDFFIKHEMNKELSKEEREKGLSDGLLLLKSFILNV